MTEGAGQTGTTEPGAWFGGVTSQLEGLTPNGGSENNPLQGSWLFEVDLTGATFPTFQSECRRTL
jgi:hypothetical protein